MGGRGSTLNCKDHEYGIHSDQLSEGGRRELKPKRKDD